MNKVNTGIKYQLLNERRRGRIFPYQYRNCPEPRMLNRTPYKEDLSGMTTKDKNKHIYRNTGEFVSMCSIGFEVEKVGFSRECIENSELFSRCDDQVIETIFFNKLETDSSCGTEGVSNILPLIPKGRWRNKIFSLMKEAECIIDDRFSPSDTTCGGHTTIGVRGMTGNTLNKRIRLFSGFVMSLYKRRMSNNYCNHNLRMDVDNYYSFVSPRPHGEWLDRERQMRDTNRMNGKYQFCLVKPSSRGQRDLIEYRVVPRFKSVKEMIRRYEFFYELVNHIIEDDNVSCVDGVFVRHGNSFGKLWRKIKPIVQRMFPNDEQRVKDIYTDSKHFQRFIDSGIISNRVRKWICPTQTEWSERIGVSL